MKYEEIAKYSEVRKNIFMLSKARQNFFLKNNLKLYAGMLGHPNLGVGRGEGGAGVNFISHPFSQVSHYFSMIFM